MSFGYGAAEHALSVLIDHGKGGKIKDAWVDNAEGLLDKTWLAIENDPLIVFERIEPADASARLAKAVAAASARASLTSPTTWPATRPPARESPLPRGELSRIPHKICRRGAAQPPTSCR